MQRSHASDAVRCVGCRLDRMMLACRDIQAAWLEYSRAAEYAHDPHALVGAELSFFGPAGLCPACAGTPESAGMMCSNSSSASLQRCDRQAAFDAILLMCRCHRGSSSGGATSPLCRASV